MALIFDVCCPDIENQSTFVPLVLSGCETWTVYFQEITYYVYL